MENLFLSRFDTKVFLLQFFESVDPLPTRVPIRSNGLFWEGYKVCIDAIAAIPKKQ